MHDAVKALIGGRSLTHEEAAHVSMFSPGLALLLKLDRVGRAEDTTPSTELKRLLQLCLEACEAAYPKPRTIRRVFQEDPSPWFRRLIEV